MKSAPRDRAAHFSSMHIALTIAGSDSGGGAGIQADLKTFHRFGVFGTSAITAVTAQNTRGVESWVGLEPGFVRKQIDAVATDLRPSAVKCGMLGTAGVVETVADAFGSHSLGPFVLDPVMVATSGDPLLDPPAVHAIRERLMPLSALATPNLDEVAVLLGTRPPNEHAMADAARRIVTELGAQAALVKGGHLDGDEIVDVLFDGELHVFRRPRIRTSSTHGTGCTLSAAIAARLAVGDSILDAVTAGLDFVHRAIRTAPGLGAGHGPLNHWA
ncbi:MAG TPA: bifunctional hydroxymethylpyrimidine kinase/phosphomethylpyrimidine kinase [Gemmatimonadaceae bacterium]|nr:bifunctional hydroxymethylpyrimidine kinase/phosphomethylpyrimidine kinase [Gemmatimonadaceae bacterium]